MCEFSRQKLLHKFFEESIKTGVFQRTSTGFYLEVLIKKKVVTFATKMTVYIFPLVFQIRTVISTVISHIKWFVSA